MGQRTPSRGQDWGEGEVVPMLLSGGVGEAEGAAAEPEDCDLSSLSVMVVEEGERPRLLRGLRCVFFSSGSQTV